VLVGFSTSFQNHAGVLQRVIDAAAALPVRLLVTLGAAIRPDEITPSANTAIVASAPHNRIMPEAALVVTHGGHGTVMAALMHRLPMLLIPHGRDQGDNAVRVTERGAGLSLPNTTSTADITVALLRLLDESSFRTAARRLGDAVAQEAETATLIDDLVRLAASPADMRAVPA
jgi:UDP:flavonoid glycosyltransferase YjiC (YdhE family)